MTSMEVPKLQFNIDLDEIEALNQKRTLAFINHWVYNTILFLNQFSSICQHKLSTLETKIRRANDLLTTLESKLSSIPGLEEIDVLNESTNHETHKTVEKETKAPHLDSITTKTQDEDQKSMTEVKSTELASSENKSVIPISSHPNFAPFFKMVNFGVPREAVKLKMSASGYDPSLLDDPTAQVEYEGKDGDDASSNSSDSQTWD